jgi:hypothetical protein
MAFRIRAKSEDLDDEKKQKKTDRRISLIVSDGMYRQLAMRKLDEGRAMNSIVVDAIRAYLKE